MTASATAKIKLSVTGNPANTLSLGSGDVGQQITYTQAFTNGSSDNEVTAVYSNRYSLAAAAVTTLDLATATDAFGNALALTKARALTFQASSTNVGTMEISSSTASAFTSLYGSTQGSLIVPIGGTIAAIAPKDDGYVVGAASKISITNNSTATSQLDVLVIGVSS